MAEVRQHEAIHALARPHNPTYPQVSRRQPGTGILEPAARTTLPSEGYETAEAEES